jgi:hypothetical protein
MDVYDDRDKPISSLKEWKEYLFRRNKQKDWKDERSAKTLAEFILLHEGTEKIKQLISRAVEEEVALFRAIPERVVRFDNYQHGREHDLAIYGQTKSTGRTIFIGLQAKEDEPFGNTISQAYLDAKSDKLSGKSTEKDLRIESLLKLHFRSVKPSHFNLRYQLLYGP